MRCRQELVIANLADFNGDNLSEHEQISAKNGSETEQQFQPVADILTAFDELLWHLPLLMFFSFLSYQLHNGPIRFHPSDSL